MTDSAVQLTWREAACPAEELANELERWSERTGIRVETWALPAADVPDCVARAVLAVLGEALANVERHSGARTVSIAVTGGSGGWRMTVSDNGQGFDQSRTGPGLDRMRAAFAEVGGRLSVNSMLGGGTTITAMAPKRR
ncbi:sensor histidine kinase [Nonomuraea lactucae]|uniref:sensor histidine kinase n=1 Tax=Nonomuraea lactucae TaxID=2249762 RepID=UPI000DE2AD9D|nr:ATP-binding protein [Nonomuraea lactucae]